MKGKQNLELQIANHSAVLTSRNYLVKWWQLPCHIEEIFLRRPETKRTCNGLKKIFSA
jgi:hypothetical protein